MQKHRNLVLVALVLAALLAAAVAAFVSSARASDRRIAERAVEIERRLQDGTSRIELNPSTKSLVRELLESDAGREQLAALDARRKDFAFDPVRGNAYWVEPELPMDPDVKYGISSVGRKMTGHSGFPSHIRLLGVRCDGAQLLLELETLEDYRHPKFLDGVWPAEPGCLYEGVAELSSLDRGYVASKNFSEYRPLER